jgi:hypothetical protein
MILLSGGTGGFNGQSNDFHSAVSYTTNTWYHWIITVDTGSANPIKVYSQGVLAAQGDTSGGATNLNLGAYKAAVGYKVSAPSEYFNGQIEKVRVYPKVLTASEVLQNYYGGPIVTDGLVFAIDAGNLVSYPKSGTTAYDLTGNTNANLRNGTGFSSKDGGTWTFDGTDDSIDVSGVYDFSISQAVTVECWAQSDNPLWNDNGYLVSRRPQFIIHPQSGTNVVGFYVRIGGSFSFVDVTVSDITKWHHYVLTYDGNDLKAYVDGIFGGSVSPGPGLDSDTGVVEIGKDDGLSRFLDGNIASVRLYDTALTSDEVLQNYNATK